MSTERHGCMTPCHTPITPPLRNDTAVAAFFVPEQPIMFYPYFVLTPYMFCSCFVEYVVCCIGSLPVYKPYRFPSMIMVASALVRRNILRLPGSHAQ